MEKCITLIGVRGRRPRAFGKRVTVKSGRTKRRLWIATVGDDALFAACVWLPAIFDRRYEILAARIAETPRSRRAAP